MSTSWNHEYDVVVAGTGMAGMAAAITAADAGLRVVLIESTDRWGGSSAMSGGGLWLPNNPLMQRSGMAGSREDALAYLEATIGDAGPATSRARKEAFVDNVGGFVDMAEGLGARFAQAKNYPERPGGKIGRALESEPFDVKRIGEWWDTSRGQDGVPAPVKTDDSGCCRARGRRRAASPVAPGSWGASRRTSSGATMPSAWGRRSCRVCWKSRCASASTCGCRRR